MRPSCSSAFRSTPSRVSFVRACAGPSLLSSAVRASVSSSLASSSSRSFSSTFPTTYRHAHWVTSREHLKEVAAQAESAASKKPGFVQGFKDKLFEPSPASSSSSSASRPSSSESVDGLDELEQSVGSGSAEETAQRRIEIEEDAMRERGEKKRKKDKLESGQRESRIDAWKAPKVVDREKAMADAIANRKIPIEYKFKTACFKVSPRKLALIGRQLSQRPIDEAILQMQFSEKRSSRRLANAMIQGRNSAVQLGMQKDKLYLQAVWVGKGATLARRNIMGRGRTGVMHHRSARMYFNLIAGQTYMEKEHVRHLQILDQIRRRGPNVHAKMNQKKARIEFMGKGHWRW